MGITANDKEKHILSLSAAGDHRAMDELYHEYAPYLAGVCYRYVLDETRMEDVLQDSFVKIFTGIGGFTYRGEGSLKAWMTRIVVNESLQELSRRSADPEVTGELPDLEMSEEEPDITGISIDEIISLTARLPEGYRAVFNMFVFDGMSHREIAGTLGISESTSASQLFKAKKMMAALVRNYQSQKQG